MFQVKSYPSRITASCAIRAVSDEPAVKTPSEEIMMFPKHILRSLAPPAFRRAIRKRLVSLKARHIYGPDKLQLSSDEAVVTCAVKNGEFYIEDFIRHYTDMGFRHIFFLDNGSTDRTISIAKQFSNVSIYECTLPVQAHQELFKEFLAEKGADGGWRLDADIDELFDYPYSDVVSLRNFLEYLNGKQYTAVVTQLLDMFADKPLAQVKVEQSRDLKATYSHYDLSNITKTPYRASEFAAKYGNGNALANKETAVLFGGIRKTLCGNHCMLTKHSLFFPGKRMKLFPHAHFVNNGRLADVSCAMLHYKLTANALEVALQNRDGFAGNGKIYDAFIDFVVNKSDHQIKQTTSARFRTVTELVPSGFLFMSDDYSRYAGGVANDLNVVDHNVVM
jgi:Glycosyl transferase family 2